MNAVEQLREHVDAIVREIVRADQCYWVLDAIGSHADDINAKGYGDFFELLQSVLQDRFILSIGKVFDRPRDRYPTHSSSTILTFLENNAHQLPITQRPWLLREMFAWNEGGISDHPADSELTLRIIRHYSRSQPNAVEPTLNALDHALHAFKTHRDKRVAHNEQIPSEELPVAKWAEARNLLDWARRLISTVGMAYLGMMYTTSKGYVLEGDARNAAGTLRALFEDLEIKEDSTEPPLPAYRPPGAASG